MRLSVTTDEGFVYFARTSSILSGATYTVSADVVCDQTISNVPLRVSSSTATSLLVNFVAGVTQRITFAAITASDDGSVQIGLDARNAIVPGGSNATGYTVTFNKVQLNEGSSATAYVATTTTPVYALRRGDRGVLIEGSRTNLLLRSQEFDDAAWTKNGSTITPNATTAPDGTLTADKLVETAALIPHNVIQGATLAATTNYTQSIIAKAAERRYIQITSSTNFSGGGSAYQNFDLQTGTLQGSVGSKPATIRPLTDGWFICSFTDTSVSAGAGQFAIVVVDGPTASRNPSYTGDGTSGIFIWGAQLEAAAFPSSYIPTVAAAATRASDVLSYTAGVTYPLQLWSEFERAVDTGTNEFVFVTDNNTSNERAVLRVSAADLGQLLITAGGAAQATIGATTLAINTVCKLAGRVNTNSAQFATNGTLGTEDTSVTLPTNPTLLRVGSDQAGTAQAFNYIRRIAVIQGAGTDAQLQSMTGS
jgi:hypothetical protein